MFTYVLITEGGTGGIQHKVKVIVDKGTITPIGATMNDFACYLTDLMLKGWRVGDGNKNTVKAVIKTFAELGSSNFYLTEEDYGDACWNDLKTVLPGFVKYMEYSAVQQYLRQIGATNPKFSSTMVFNPDDNIPLLSVLRTLTPGKIKLSGVTPNGLTEFLGDITVSNLSVDGGWETQVLPHEIARLAENINTHITRIDKELGDTHEKMIKGLQKAVEEARSKEMSKQFKNLQRMFSAGWELKNIADHGGKEMYHMTKDIVVEYLEIPLKQITGRSIDSSSIVTVPLPPSYKKYMVIKDLIVEPNDRIGAAWAKGHSPHLSGGSSGGFSSVCIGDSGGKPISEIGTLAESLRHVNIGSMFGNTSSSMINDLVNSIKSNFAKNGEVDLIDPKTKEKYGRLEISAGQLKGQKGTLFSTATAFTAASGEAPMAVVEEDEGVWEE